MIILLICILCNVLLAVVFKSFQRYSINNHHAIVINYGICVLIGSIAIGDFAIPMDLLQKSWWPFSLLLALLFITGFNVLALSFQKCGVAFTIIVQKMSLIMPILFAVVLYREHMTFVKILGVVAAFLAIITVNYPDRNPNSNSRKIPYKWLILPLLAFVMSGIIEIVLYYVEVESLVDGDSLAFTSTAFGLAGLMGIVYSLFLWIKKKQPIQLKEVVGGISLGLPNFLTIYLLLVMLKKGWEGTVLFPLNSIGTLLFTALVGIILYQEGVTRTKIVGLVLSLVAIALIGFF